MKKYRKIGCICTAYILFFILSFVDGFSAWLQKNSLFFFFACILFGLVLGCIHVFTTTNNRWKYIGSLFFYLLFLLACREATDTFSSLKDASLEKWMLLCFTGILVFLNLKKDKIIWIQSITLLILSILGLCLYETIGYGIVVLIYLVCSVYFNRKQSIYFSLLCGLEILFMFLSKVTTLFYGYSIIFGICVALEMFNQLFMDFRQTNEKEKQLQEAKKEVSRLNEETLKSQIKPHFLFNSLTTIDVLYMQNHEKGKNTLNKLMILMQKTNHLLEEKTIPFSVELDIVKSYIDLMNEIEKQPFILKTDLMGEDFLIPPLSIEPIIENAIRYSNVNKKENGCICIETKRIDDRIQICISDNGDGFNIEKIKDTSIGLKNIISRYRNYNNGEVLLSSVLNEGTKVEIRFMEGMSIQ